MYTQSMDIPDGAAKKPTAVPDAMIWTPFTVMPLTEVDEVPLTTIPVVPSTPAPEPVTDTPSMVTPSAAITI